MTQRLLAVGPKTVPIDDVESMVAHQPPRGTSTVVLKLKAGDEVAFDTERPTATRLVYWAAERGIKAMQLQTKRAKRASDIP